VRRIDLVSVVRALREVFKKLRPNRNRESISSTGIMFAGVTCDLHPQRAHVQSENMICCEHFPAQRVKKRAFGSSIASLKCKRVLRPHLHNDNASERAKSHKPTPENNYYLMTRNWISPVVRPEHFIRHTRATSRRPLRHSSILNMAISRKYNLSQTGKTGYTRKFP
jgi:hypothetical protein